MTDLLAESANAKLDDLISKAVAPYEPVSTLAFGEKAEDFAFSIKQAISTIWEKDFPQAPIYNFNNMWQEGVVWQQSASMGSPVTVDDVRAREIESRLNALGSHPKAVAESLRKQDITGFTGSPSGCAIAEWLKKNFEGYGAVQVGPHSVHLLATDGAHIAVATTPAVRDFIRMFDAQAFPELIADRGGSFYAKYLASAAMAKAKAEQMEVAFSVSVPSTVPEFVPSL